jgi:hypothetical protein
VLVVSAIDLSSFAIENNGGPGVVRAFNQHDGGGDLQIWTQLAGSLRGNGGPGMFAEHGKIGLYAPVTVADNAGIGVFAENDLSIDTIGNGATGRTTVSGNGLASACQMWTVEGDLPLQLDDAPCPRGGLETEARLTGHHFDVVDNAGDGVTAGISIDIHDATVCGNEGDELVSPSITTESVDTCGEGPAPGDDGDDGFFGCRAGRDPGWLIAVLAILLGARVRRPRRARRTR